MVVHLRHVCTHTPTHKYMYACTHTFTNAREAGILLASKNIAVIPDFFKLFKTKLQFNTDPPSQTLNPKRSQCCLMNIAKKQSKSFHCIQNKHFTLSTNIYEYIIHKFALKGCMCSCGWEGVNIMCLGSRVGFLNQFP